jgi:hypothetical protein
MVTWGYSRKPTANVERDRDYQLELRAPIGKTDGDGLYPWNQEHNDENRPAGA